MKGNTLNKQLTVLMFLLLNCFVSCSEDDNMILKRLPSILQKLEHYPTKFRVAIKTKLRI